MTGEILTQGGETLIILESPPYTTYLEELPWTHSIFMTTPYCKVVSHERVISSGPQTIYPDIRSPAPSKSPIRTRMSRG